MQCSRCGKALPGDSRFCLACGHPVPATAPAPPPRPPQYRPPPAPPPPRAPAPPPTTHYGAFAPAPAPPEPPRRPVWALFAVIGVLALIVAGLSISWAVRSLTASGKPTEEGPSVVTVAPRPGDPGDLTTAPPPAPPPPGRSITPAQPPPPGGRSPLAAPPVGGPVRDFTLIPPPVSVGGAPIQAGGNAPPVTEDMLRARNAPRGGYDPVRAPQRPAPTPSSPARASARPAEPAEPTQATPQPTEPQPQKMPPDIAAYLWWLAHVDTSRANMEDAALDELPQWFIMMMDPTGTLFNPDPTAEPTVNPAQIAAMGFQRWYQRLASLQRLFVGLQGLQHFLQRFGIRGPARVPPSCARLHQLYGQALAMQVQAANGVAAGMANMQLSAIVRQQASSGPTQNLLRQADMEYAALCERYSAPKQYRIRINQGDLAASSLFPR